MEHAPCKWSVCDVRKQRIIYSRAEDKVAETPYPWRKFSVSSSERRESFSEKRYLANVYWFTKQQILRLGKLLRVGAELGASKQRISNPYSQMRAPYPADSSTHLGALSKPYLRCGDEELKESIQALNGMDQRRLVASTHMVIYLLQRCINEDDLGAGRELHRILAREGLNSDTSIGNRLIHMFVYFESLSEAKQAFDTLCRPDVSSWSAIILAHVKLEHNEEAIRLYNQLRKSWVEPDGHVYVAVLKACCGMEALEVGRSIHASIIECGLRPDFFIDSALMDMYMKCWSIDDACMVFGRSLKPNAVMWNVLIAGYAQHVDGHEALQIFQHMQQDGVEADQATFVCVLKACAVTASLQQGKHIHVLVMEAGLESDLFVGSTLIDMYVKCAALEDAIMVFGRLSRRNVVTWSALIAGHVQHGNGFKALQLFQGMLQEGLVPNRVTFICVLKACSSIAALEKGRQCHSFIIERGLETDTVVSSALTDMYGKCGSMKEACTVFNRFPKRDVVTWSALIAGYTQHNDYFSASKCFKHMLDAGWKPDAITFLCLLSACNRVGLLEAGCRHFKLMVDGYGILPILDHFNSMVDLFGHLGLMKEAEDLLETIPYRPNNIGWRSLLSSCRKHSSIDVGRRCFDYILSTDYTNAAGYVLMTQIYEEAGMQDDAEKVKELRRCAKGWKKPAKAFIEIDKELHEFSVGDKAHSRSNDIFAKLRTLSSQIKAETCKPGLELDPKLVEGKEDAVCGHCEKLAIAFGLISTPQGTTIRIAKNLCMCSDCHLFTKLISKLERREIIVKDSYQIHNFEEGACSCKDR